MFGAARYGKGHNIASMDCVVASLAMGRIQQAFLTKAIRQSKKHHTAAERERECKAAARARAVRPGKESGTKDSPVPTSESGDDMEDDDDDDDDDYSDDLDDGSDDLDDDDDDDGVCDDEDGEGATSFMSDCVPEPGHRRATHATMSFEMASAGARFNVARLVDDGDNSGQEEHEAAEAVAAAVGPGGGEAEVKALASAATDLVLADCKRVAQFMEERGACDHQLALPRDALVAFSERMAKLTAKTTYDTMHQVHKPQGGDCCCTTCTTPAHMVCVNAPHAGQARQEARGWKAGLETTCQCCNNCSSAARRGGEQEGTIP
jgi:hypothetical protein